jgi:hypothetical protein
MPFTPGHPKYGGRKKGRANHVTLKTRDELWASIDQLCAQGQAANPFRVLVDLMVSDPEARVQCAIALADRLLPKLKAVELSGDPDKPLHLTLTPAQRDREIARLTAKYLESLGAEVPAVLRAQMNGYGED